MIRKAEALLSAMTKVECGTESFFCMHKNYNEKPFALRALPLKGKNIEVRGFEWWRKIAYFLNRRYNQNIILI